MKLQTIILDDETYYYINDNDINTPSSNKSYYINIFGNKVIRKCITAKNQTTYKQLSPQNIDGYLVITISGYHKKLHILSAKTFINPLLWNKMKTPSIDHIDGDGLNNHWTNLRFMDRSENASMHHILPRKHTTLEDSDDDVVFNSINNNPLKHSYKYNIATKLLYMQFINAKTNEITYKLIDSPTRYKFQNNSTKVRFTVSKNVLHTMMKQKYDEQHTT